MALNIPERVSSLQTIVNSIRYDPQVVRWFLLLVEQPAVQKKILAHYPEGKKDYQLLLAIPTLELIGGLLALVLGAWCWQMKHWGGLGLLIVLVIYPTWRIIVWRRQVIAELSRKFLVLEFPPEELPKKSLYQIAEILGQSYAIPTLVDTIYHWDRALRVGILIFGVVVSFIYPLKIVAYITALAVFFFVLKTLLRWRVIYQRMR